MNIFQKIAWVNKLFKCIEIIKDFSSAPDVKKGIKMIKDGIALISKVVPETQDRYNEIEKVLKK